MLHRERRLKGALVRGTDGDIGVVERLYFDDEQWTIRYLVIDRDKSLNGGFVLIPSSAIGPGWNVAMVVANVTLNQVRELPEIAPDADPPPLTAGVGSARLPAESVARRSRVHYFPVSVVQRCVLTPPGRDSSSRIARLQSLSVPGRSFCWRLPKSSGPGCIRIDSPPGGQ